MKLTLNVGLVEEDLPIGRPVHRTYCVRLSVLLQYLSEHSTTTKYRTRKVKVKVKLALEQATKAQRGRRRVGLLSLQLRR